MDIVDLVNLMNEEKKELQKLGLTDDEIDGYFDYYIENYIEKEISVKGDN